MPSLIHELQRDALDSSIPVVDLLRKALVVASKLKIDELEMWIQAELKGYSGEGSPPIPDYRVISATLKAKNPFHGYVPVIFSDKEDSDLLSRFPMGQGLAQIEHLVNSGNTKSSSGTLHAPPPGHLHSQLGLDLPTSWEISKAQLHGVLSTVRDLLLQWALRLENNGILGEGLTFSAEEKRVAESQDYHLTITGDHASIQIARDGAIQSQGNSFDLKQLAELIKKIREAFAQSSIDETQKAQVASDTQTIEAQIVAPTPNHGIIRESLKSLRSILEGAAAGMLSRPDLLPAINDVLGRPGS